MINIYCDESCHLEHDKSNVMVLGAMSCDKSKKKFISEDLRALKENYGLSRTYELKWTKTSNAKIEYYNALTRYFCHNPDLSFRAVIAPKINLDHKRFNQTHDDWYYKMYYYLLRNMIHEPFQYAIYPDIKDSCGGEKISKLNTILKNTIRDNNIIKTIQLIRSEESELLQLVDFFIGAICYLNRGLETSRAKLEVVQMLKKETGLSLQNSTSPYDSKFNIFYWFPQSGGGESL